KANGYQHGVLALTEYAGGVAARHMGNIYNIEKIRFYQRRAFIAQLAERDTSNVEVSGSNPLEGS
ncbi:hypothetical protein Cpir12675_006716, partial [Ceratocystis pirilliformis]